MAIIRTGVLFLSVSFTALGYLLGSCGVHTSCAWHALLAPHSFTVFEPLFLYSLCMIPVALILLNAPESVVRRWLSFARWYVPVCVLVLILVPEHNGTSLPLYSVSKESAAWGLGVIGIGMSLYIRVRTRTKESD